MALTKWICNRSSTKQMFVKIVHQGGHVELHESPVLAGEIMKRYPKCCVAHPNVFQNPWNILAPENTLMLGHKFYVVPKRTVRRLQSMAQKPSPSMVREIQKLQSYKDEVENNGNVATSCLSFHRNRNIPRPSYASLKHDKKKNGDDFFTRLLTGMRIIGGNEDINEEKKSSESLSNSGLNETKMLCRNKGMDSDGRTEISPNRLSSFDNWQPHLESIIEE